MKIIKNPGLLLIVILLIASFFRLYDITKLPPGFYPDEAMYANNGVEAWETGQFKVFYPENYGREGLWMNIIGFFVFKFGPEPWIPRTVAAVFGILTVLGVYFLTKELFKNKIALLASFFLATSFWHINFSRIAFRAILSPFFLVWGIYFLLKAFNLLKSLKNKVQLIGLCLVGGIFYGLGFHSYIAYRVTPLLILIILLLYWSKIKKSILETSDIQNIDNKNFGMSDVLKLIRKKFLISILCFLISAFIVAAPLGLYFLKNPQNFLGRTSEISIFSSPNPVKALTINILKTAGMFNFVGDSNWRHNYAGKPELFWPVGILFLLGIFLGIKSITKRNQRFEFIVLFFWLLIAALPVVVSNERLPHALRAILIIPPVFILAGVGGWRFYEIFVAALKKSKNLRLFNIFVLIFLSLLIFEAYVTYFVLWGQNSNVYDAFSANYVEIGRQLNVLPKELPKYVVVKAEGVDVRGIPMPAQTVMFITDTFTPEKQKEKNIFYLLPEQINQIPKKGYAVILE